ncbi:unnamed protein product [Dibothriocephalus latus]|uniref:Uncharacterized protein n=1 Tax=Dibothriocephalus latus TaxID=60516 RepID=A0A3P7L0U5_DIBLA|nr:unnamed protein product [Dibothriocephalus latus]
MELEPWQVHYNGSGRPNIPANNEGEREDEVKYYLGNSTPSLRNRVTEVPQGPGEDVNNATTTPLQSTSDQTGTATSIADWQQYVFTALSNIERHVASTEGRITALDGRIVALENAVLGRRTTTAASTSSCKTGSLSLLLSIIFLFYRKKQFPTEASGSSFARLEFRRLGQETGLVSLPGSLKLLEQPSPRTRALVPYTVFDFSVVTNGSII